MSYAQKKREKRAQDDETRRPATREAAFGSLSDALNRSAKVQAQLQLDRSLNQPTGGDGVAQMGKKGRETKGGRSHKKKSGSKGQRDKKPGLMGDPRLGTIFTRFWHGFKQKHGGNIQDYDGDYILNMTLAQLVGGESESPNADKTVQWFFSRYLEEKHPDLYAELSGAAQEEEDTEEDEEHQDHDEDEDEEGEQAVGVY